MRDAGTSLRVVTLLCAMKIALVSVIGVASADKKEVKSPERVGKKEKQKKKH